MDPSIKFAAIDREPVETAAKAVTMAGIACVVRDNDPDHAPGQPVHFQRYSLEVHGAHSKAVERVLRNFDRDFVETVFRKRSRFVPSHKFDVCVDLLTLINNGQQSEGAITSSLDALLSRYGDPEAESMR